MKHFLPSSVMLTPFLVKNYDKEEELESIEEQQISESESSKEQHQIDVNNEA
ncbi:MULTISPECIES: hypothetical protein [Vibrio]|uniref:hypothetical protein n=1 Tax=Vibrio TaxID=662 RepID=UPI00142E93C8|nr:MULTISPECIES: hypothetical protein [Vibrio]